MTLGGEVRLLTIPGDAVLTAYRGRWVAVGADGNLDVLSDMSSAATVPLGVLVHAPVAAGAPASVAITGSVVKLDMACSIEEGQLVQATTDGWGTPFTSGTGWVGGVCIRPSSGSPVPCAVLVHPAWVAVD